METLAPFITYAIALAVAAVIPGPGIAALVGHALGGNLRSSLMFLAGIALGDLVYLTVAIIGLAAIAQSFAGAFIVLKIFGAVYLLYLAIVFWTSEAGLTKVRLRKQRSGPAAVLAAFVLTLGNPKTVVFYLALLPTVLDLGKVSLSDWLSLSALTVIILFATLTPYALLAAKARALMTRPAALKRLNRIASATIGGAGAFILGEAAIAAFRRGSS